MQISQRCPVHARTVYKIYGIIGGKMAKNIGAETIILHKTEVFLRKP
jgi:hypothetical protein